ncbi:MAG: LamG-like jellyroll fold domain-containing protein [Sedimentisphaerales bacterium]|nr:LamG-like jellyroll fold domain-containing protein [Sedimentisphaerales bacterium]
MSGKLRHVLSLILVIGLIGGVVNADPLRQDTGPDGIVSVEAEDYDANVEVGGHAWVETGPVDGFIGEAGMHAPNGQGGHSSDYADNSERLEYEIQFEKTGTHYVWILAWGASGTDDSCHVGLDGEATPLSSQMSGGWSGGYAWNNSRYQMPEPSQIDIVTAGLHTLNIWVREDGLIIDKIVLTTNPNYRPSGNGPPLSHRGARLKAYDPIPGDGASHEDNWVSLNWTAGETAVSHDVYFGDIFSEVDEGSGDTFRGNQTTGFYVAGFPGFAFPDGLPTGNTYYWRIDEVEADGTINKGDVWSLTIPPRKAYNPIPGDGTEFIDPETTISWTPGLGAKLHHLYFGDSFDDVNAGAPNTYKGPVPGTSYSPGILAIDKDYYWRVDEFALTGTATGDVWSFRTIPEIPVTNPNLIGWWKIDAGKGLRVIDWSGNDNHGSLEDNPQWSEGFDGVGLEFDGTNSVGLSGTDMIGSDIGSVSLWIKTTQAGVGMIFYGTASSGDGFGDQDELHVNMMADGRVQFYIEGGDTDVNIDAAAVNDDAWHHITATWDINADAKLYVDGSNPISAPHTANSFTLSGSIRLGQPASRQRFYDGLIDDVRVYNYVLSPDDIALIMRGDVTLAWNPRPASGSTSNIDDVTSVSWSAGDNAVQHDVYFGTDKDAVASADASDTSGIYRGQQGATNYSPPEGIEWGQTHYWRIDENNTDGTVSTGRLWSFTIADHIVVDDMESYNDLDESEPGSNRIYLTWVDGFDNPATNGSIVGYATAPFAEQTIVHGGGQSMPFAYDNAVGKSEATLTLTYPRDWSRHGVGVLSLWFKGNPAGFLEDSAGTITMSAGGADIWNTADEFRYAYKQLSGAGSITAQVLSVDNTDPWAKAGVMIRQTLDPGSKFAAVYITPGNGCRYQARLTPGSGATSDTSVATTEQMAIKAPYWIRIERDAADNFNGYYSSDGVSWQAMSWNPQKISMPPNAYIGLAFTSHNTSVIGEAQFANVTTTGSVSPLTWTHEAIGVEMASNDPEPMYVALNGNAVVQHDNPEAALINDWTQWNIDLTLFADQGVNLANVNTITIGFGDKNNPQAGGSGSAFFDDIQLQRP